MTDRQEELKLLQRAVAAGLLPAESLERALDQSGDGDSLFQHLAGDDRLSAPELALVRKLSDSQFEGRASQETSSSPPAAEHDTAPTPSEVVRLPGLPERYERLKSIGSGGMGWVFSAHDAKLKRDVAIKVLKWERAGDSWTKMMLRESEVLARLKHPGLVPIYDVGHLADDSPYLVMPYVAGVNLDEYAGDRKLSWREAVAIARQIAEAVGHAHLVNIVHRDLKPGNVRITPEGSAVVLDFGIAKPVADGGADRIGGPAAPDATAARLDGEQVWKPSYETCGPGGAGTPSYMSPEQAAGDAVDLRTDVYSLGVVLFYLLAGRLPWPREVYLERKRLCETIQRESPPRLPPTRPRIPADLKAIVARCLSVAPSDRYADGREVASELRRLTDGFPVESFARNRPWYVLGKFVQRQRAVVIAVVAAVAALLFAIVAMMYARLNRMELDLAAERQRVEQQVAAGKIREARLRTKLETDRREATAHLGGIERAVSGLHRGEITTARRALNEIPAARAGFETARLDLETGRGIRPTSALSGHEYELLDGALDPNRRRLATTGFDGKVLVWDLADSRVHAVLRPGAWCKHLSRWRNAFVKSKCCADDTGLRDLVVRLAWLPDGRRLVGATRGGQLVVWDVDTRQESTLLQHSSPLVAVAASPAGVILASDNQGRLMLGAADSGSTFKTLPARSGEVSVLVAVTGGWCIGRLDGQVSVTDESVEHIRQEIGFRGPIWDLAFDPDERALAVAPNEPRVALVSLRMETPNEPVVRSLAMTEGICEFGAVPQSLDIDGRRGRIVAGDSTGQCTIWSLASGTVEMQLKAIDRGPMGDALEKLPEVYRRLTSNAAFSADGTELWTGGANTLIMKWRVDRERLRHEWQAGPRPAAVFDRERADLVWVASGGRLEIVDSWTSRLVAATELERGEKLRGLVAATLAPVYASFSERSIQLWRRVESAPRADDDDRTGEQRIEVAQAAMLHDVDILGLALSSDGRIAATYDVRNKVAIWNVEDGRKIQSISIVADDTPAMPRDQRPLAYGQLFFNADDSQLLVVGPAQSPTILSGPPWEIRRRPGVASHLGPSAAAWSPTNDSLLVVGDSSGSVRSDPLSLPGLPRMRIPVLSLAFSPDGRRIVAGAGNGNVLIIDADENGSGQLAMLAAPPSAKSRSKLTSLQFDPTGSRLMATFDDGLVHIWESQSSPLRPPPPAGTPNSWDVTTHACSRDSAEQVISNRAALVLDAQDRIAALIFRQRPLASAGRVSKTSAAERTIPLPDARSSETWSADVVLVREQSVEIDRSKATPGATLTTIDELGAMPPSRLTSLGSSLGLSLDAATRELDAIYSRPVAGTGDYVREIMAIRRLGTPGQVRIQLAEPSNYGLHSELLRDPKGDLYACHFAYSDYYTLAHRLSRSKTTDLFGIGRQGDILTGVEFDRHGWLHFVGQARRWPTDPQQQVIYRAIDDLAADFDVDGATRQINETIFHGGDVTASGLSVDSAGRPIVQYTTLVSPLGGGRPGRQLHLATRDNGRWSHELVLDATVPFGHVSRTAAHADGRLLFAFTRSAGLSTEVCLATRHEGRWTVQTVHVLRGDELQEFPPSVTPLTLHVDSRGKLVIAGLAADHEGARMLVLRPSSE